MFTSPFRQELHRPRPVESGAGVPLGVLPPTPELPCPAVVGAVIGFST
jgi:hypothetical protein